MERAVAALAEDVKVVGDEKNVFHITATSGRSDLSDGENAQLAQDIAQRMIDIFREENLGESRGEMRETIAFLDQQLAQRQKELDEAEARRLAFEAEHPELIGGPASITAQLNAVRDELRGVEADLAAAQSALAALDGQLAGTPRTLAGAGSAGPRAALAQAEANLAALEARGLTANHPDVVALNKQIASLRTQAQGPGADLGGTPNPAWTSLQAMKVERQANVQALTSRAAALRAEIASITSAAIMKCCASSTTSCSRIARSSACGARSRPSAARSSSRSSTRRPRRACRRRRTGRYCCSECSSSASGPVAGLRSRLDRSRAILPPPASSSGPSDCP